MFGMMLPSGNDAAQALGIHFGQIILSNGMADPVIEISEKAIERRLQARKVQLVMEKNRRLQYQKEEQLRLQKEKEKEAAKLRDGMWTQESPFDQERVSCFNQSFQNELHSRPKFQPELMQSHNESVMMLLKTP